MEIVQNMGVHEPVEEPTKKSWDEGNWFALTLGLGAAFLWGPLLGFYFGTVAGSPHITDLQLGDIHNGVIGACIGFVVGLGALVAIMVIYPSRTKKDLEDWKELNSHPRFSGKH